MEVQLDAGDNLSGVAVTHYQLDDEPVADGKSLRIDTAGVHSLQVWSVDRAGNVEPQQNVTVKIDRTAPGITHTQSPDANARGWNRTDVTVTFHCTDEASGVASCSGPATRGEGASQKVVGTAIDRAGNTATDETTVNVDKTKPVVTGELSVQPNANNWYKAHVVATFTCADQDGLSGVISCPESHTFGPGKAQASATPRPTRRTTPATSCGSAASTWIAPRRP